MRITVMPLSAIIFIKLYYTQATLQSFKYLNFVLTRKYSHTPINKADIWLNSFS